MKNISGHKFDRIEDFDGLRVAIRRLEQDQQKPDPAMKPQGMKMMKADPVDSRFDSLERKVKQLTAKVDSLHNQQRSAEGSGQPRKMDPPNLHYRMEDQSPRFPPTPRRAQQVCWRCGEPGHIRYDCRARLDHSRQSLNGQGSTGWGNQWTRGNQRNAPL